MINNNTINIVIIILFFSKLGPNPPMDVTLKLVKTKCLPILMYGMCAAKVSSKELIRVSYAYNTILWKLFQIKTKEEINFVQYFCNYLNFPDLVNYYRFCFLNKVFARGLLHSRSRIDKDDYEELLHLCKRCNLKLTDSNYCVKKKLWSIIELNLDAFLTVYLHCIYLCFFFHCTLLSYFVFVIVLSCL